ncbi:swr complex subunit [Onygenales sp. PD_10]|nr:swr complex subunit [Onygenales sp. PD_10]
MAAADVRDMLDLPADGGPPRPHKKQKVVEKRPEGITRELFALLGERAPPIALNENKYKGRRKWMSKLKVRPWEMAPFENAARSDGLVLRHWQRKRAPVNESAPSEAAHGEEGKEPGHQEKKPEDVYAFAKYNVKAQLPKRYTDEQYNRFLKSHAWSREETDYLMDLAQEYDLRWVIIADRYDYPPSQPSSNGNGDSTALVPANQRRTMEELKARYYTVAANMLALEHPPSEMSEAEFDLHEKMTKYDPEQERARKELANLQLNRSKDEVAEETLLLEELKRIVGNEKNFIEERKELYARLEAPISSSNTTMYQTSQGLAQLLSSLLHADKSKKRRPLIGPETGTSSPASQPSAQNLPQSARESRPETPAAAAPPAGNKKAAAAAAAAQPTIKTLTPSEEAKYGVTHHDRLTSGVQFRNDKAQKLTQAKSNIQSQKLAAALTELQIPPRLVMPTEKVCKEFEKLIHSVNLLLDVRKFAEKVEGEIRVLEAAKEERERKEREKLEEGTGNETEKDKQQPENTQTAATATNTTKPPIPSGTAAPAAPPHQRGDDTGTGNIKKEPDDTTKGPGPGHGADAALSHKRSASVLSSVSDKSTKRQRK